MARDDGEWWLRGAPVPVMEPEPEPMRPGERVIWLAGIAGTTMLAERWTDRFGLLDGGLRAFAVLLVATTLAIVGAHMTGWGGILRLRGSRAERVATVVAPLVGSTLYLVGAFALPEGGASTALRIAGVAIVAAWKAVETFVALRKRRADRRLAA